MMTFFINLLNLFTNFETRKNKIVKKLRKGNKVIISKKKSANYSYIINHLLILEELNAIPLRHPVCFIPAIITLCCMLSYTPVPWAIVISIVIWLMLSYATKKFVYDEKIQRHLERRITEEEKEIVLVLSKIDFRLRHFAKFL